MLRCCLLRFNLFQPFINIRFYTHIFQQFY
nr:MAG TPA: hypothetical protein [Caudoviricetes sp.]